MRRILLSSVPCLHNILPHYLMKGTIFEKRIIEHKLCVLISYTTLYKIFLILRRIQRDITSSCKGTVIIVRYYWNLNFLDRFSKKFHVWNVMKTRAVGTELFDTDWQNNGHRHDEGNKLHISVCILCNIFDVLFCKRSHHWELDSEFFSTLYTLLFRHIKHIHWYIKYTLYTAFY